METLSLKLQYRPVRIGWCIRKDDIEGFRQSILLTHTLWGGRYNPVIVVEDENQATAIIDKYRVDALFAVNPDDEIKRFIQRYQHISWPIIHQSIFIEDADGALCNFVDVSHPMRKIKKESKESGTAAELLPLLYQWTEDDPLKDMLLLTVGNYPVPNHTVADYFKYFDQILRPNKFSFDKDKSIPSNFYTHLSPNRITRSFLDSYFFPYGIGGDGIYCGSSRNLNDLINYWNLRAAGTFVLFYDKDVPERCTGYIKRFLSELRTGPKGKGFDEFIYVWHSGPLDVDNVRSFGNDLMFSDMSKKELRYGLREASHIGCGEFSVLASVSDSGDRSTITFALDRKPFFDEPYFHTQHVMLNVSSYGDISTHGKSTIKPPNIPELNPIYQDLTITDQVRVNGDGFALIVSATTDHCVLSSLDSFALLKELFLLYEMQIEVSRPGLICNRLISQMDGLQGCRVFKISGVRTLIEKYKPEETFTRSGAIETIGENDPLTKKPSFEKYQDLYLGPRHGKNLAPDHAFSDLLEHNVFRVGLEFKCTNCLLPFWLELDNVKSVSKCEYCGSEVKIATQLKDRDWKYRRSGLFGRDDHQQGGIPVSVVLQQLDTLLHHDFLYSTGINVHAPMKGKIFNSGTSDHCEIDLCMLARNRLDKTQLLMGEVKTRDSITKDDVDNLVSISNLFDRKRVEVFILIAKLSVFSDDEVTMCREAYEVANQKIIMLSARELEPYYVYTRVSEEFGIRRHVSSLEDLVEGTRIIYFGKKMRGK